MASLKVMLGNFPATSKIESEEAALIKDHKDFNAYTRSDELKRFEELEGICGGSEFADKKKAIKSQKFKNTEEFKKLQEFNGLKKAKHIKSYYKTKSSKELEDYKRLDGSDELKKYEELAEYVNSQAFTEQKSSKEFKDSDAARKEQEFNNLKNSASIKGYFKFKSSADLENFKKLDGSEEIAKYEELEKFIESDQFKEVKDYMALSGQKKYEQSDEFKLEEEYLGLKKSEKINWYLKLRQKNEFDKITNWELTFEDDFSGSSLDSNNWMSRYFWGEALLKDNYSLPGDLHCNTDGRNVEMGDGKLKIVTKSETCEGKLWNPVAGFILREFKYTSGLVSTGKSFRQKYGKFKVKVKFAGAPIRQSVFMVGEKILPHIDLVKVEKGKANFGNFWGNIAEKGGVNKKVYKKGASKFSNDYFIYTVEWSPEKISWMVNDLEVLSQTEGIPEDPMYLVLGAGVTSDVSGLPASMEVDWVRVYKKVDRSKSPQSASPQTTSPEPESDTE
jgi:beta-glucanase (GH16 family)